jgi:hypothetical protein
LLSRAQAQWFCSLPDKIRRQHFSAEEHDSILAGLEHSRGTREFGPVHRISAIQDRRTSSTSLPPTMDPKARPQLTISRQQSQLRSSTSTHHTLIGSPTSPTHHHRGRSATGTLVSFPRPSVDSVGGADGEAVYYRNPEARSKLRQYLASPQKFDEALTYGFPSSPQPDEDGPERRLSPPSTANNDAKAFLQGHDMPFIDGLEMDLPPEAEDEAGSEAASEPDTDSPSTPGDADWSWRTSKYNRLSIFGGLDTDSLPSLSLNAYQLPPLPTRRPPPTSPAPAMPRSPLLLYDPALPPAPGASNLLNREMTLRMTLTRPDLRADDEALYGWQSQQHKAGPLQHLQQLQQRRGSSASIVKQQQMLHQRREQEQATQQRKSSLLAEDPLALEELPPLPDDPSGSRGVFALPEVPAKQQQPGGKKMFRRLLGRVWR